MTSVRIQIDKTLTYERAKECYGSNIGDGSQIADKHL